MLKQRMRIRKWLLGSLLLVNSAWACADIVVITNLNNPADRLDNQEVRKVFLGRLHLYPATDHEPLAIDHPQNSKSYRSFYDAVIGISPAKLKQYRAYYLFSGKGKIPFIADSQEDVIRSVKQSTYAISYLLDPDQDTLKQVKILYRQPSP